MLNRGTQTWMKPFGKPRTTRMRVHFGKPTIGCPSAPTRRVSTWLAIHSASADCGSAYTTPAETRPLSATPAPASLRNPRRVSPASDMALSTSLRYDPLRCPPTHMVQQNDPTELLEVFDAGGQPTGRAKTRASIHLDGDWHQAFHCWILRRNRDEIVLQRRSLAKDTFPGCWDAAAAGHWRFGETAAEAAREIAEELGLDVNFADLTFRGRERGARRFANGLIDREHHQVYVLESDRPLTDYHPDPSEVIGLAAFASREVLRVAVGRLSNMRAT